MNRYQLNVTEMTSTVSAYMAKNHATWQSNKAISDTVVEVDADLTTIAGLDTKQQLPTTGAAVDKATIRFDYEGQILLIAHQLAALAAKNNDGTLEAQADLSLSGLDKLAADELEAAATRIAALATTNLLALADYGILPADLTKLADLATKFHAAKTGPRSAVVDRKIETDLLQPLVSNLLSTLRRQLDRQLITFKGTNPDFYAGYLTARVIVERGHPAKKPVIAPVKPTP